MSKGMPGPRRLPLGEGFHYDEGLLFGREATPGGLPLDFSLNEEQKLLKKTVREFAESELAPHAREWDEKQEFPRSVFQKLGELGLMGVAWPPEYGGSGMSTLEWAIVMEELSRVDAGVALSLAAHH